MNWIFKKELSRIQKNKLSQKLKKQEKSNKIFKLSDFGICKNIHRERPSEFGAGNYLAPEVCMHGPDSTNVGEKANRLDRLSKIGRVRSGPDRARTVFE